MKKSNNKFLEVPKKLSGTVLSTFPPQHRGDYIIKLSVIGAPVSKTDKTIKSVSSVCVIVQNDKTDAVLTRFFSHEDQAVQFIDDLAEGRLKEDIFQKVD